MSDNLSRLIRYPLRLVLIAVFVFYPIVLALDYFYVFEPYLYPLHLMQGRVRSVSSHILIGPYPEFMDLQQLRAQGVRVVISLLDPRLIYERGLIAKEQRYERRLGMTFYDIPLDSYRSASSARNARDLVEIKRVLTRLHGRKVYIHCYLGKHRVQYVADAVRRPVSARPASSHGPIVRN